MASEKLKILVFLGSTRDGRMGDRVAKFIMSHLSTKHNAELIDPLQLDIPLLRQPLHFYKDQSIVPKVLVELNEKVKGADAIVVVTPEYNRHLPPALLNTLDHFPPTSYAHKNSAIVAYSMGPQGGAIAAQQARTLLTELGCLPISFNFTVAGVQNQFDEDGKPTADPERMDSGMKRLMEQLEWWAGAAKMRRAQGP